MDFEQLVLSTEELNTLRVIAQKPVKSNPDWMVRTERLRDLGLIDSELDADRLPKNGYVYSISEDGKSYLRYLERRESEKQFENNMSTLSLKETRFANKLSVLALIVSAIALLVSIFR